MNSTVETNVEQMRTLRPFVLLCRLRDTEFDKAVTVYRRANLSDATIEQFIQAGEGHRGCFPAFTSTTRNRAIANQQGNVLVEIRARLRSQSADISSSSDYPHEEDVLIDQWQESLRVH